MRPTADAVCTSPNHRHTAGGKDLLHIPLAESRKVASERRAVGAVFPAGRGALRNPKILIHCLLGFWGPVLAFGCGISAQKCQFHTWLSFQKVPLSCKIGWFCPDFPILIRQNRDFPSLAKSSWWHGKNSRFSSFSCKFGIFWLYLHHEIQSGR